MLVLTYSLGEKGLTNVCYIIVLYAYICIQLVFFYILLTRILLTLSWQHLLHTNRKVDTNDGVFVGIVGPCVLFLSTSQDQF